MAVDIDAYIKKNSPDKLDDYISRNTPTPEGPDLAKSGQAFLEHYGNAATLGHLPQLQAGVAKSGLLPDPNRDVDNELKRKGFKIVENENQPSYTDLRDQNIKRLETQSKENPYASIAGTGTGFLANALLGSKLIPVGPAATFGKRALQSGKVGAAIAGASNPGDVEGEIHPFQPGERLTNASRGFVTGVATQGLLEGAGKLASKGASYFGKKANERAIGAVGATASDFEKLRDQGQQKLGKEALDSGIVKPLSTPGVIAQRTDAIREKVGQDIGKLIQTADRAGAPKIDASKLGANLLSESEVQLASKTPGMTGMYKAAEEGADLLSKNGQMTLAEAHGLRMRIDKSIKFNRRRMDLAPGSQEVLYKIRDGINTAINDSINSVKVAGMDGLKKLNSQYSNLSQIEGMAQSKAASNAANRTFGLTDTIAGAAGLASGSTLPEKALLTVAAGAANKFGRTFGKSLQATGFNNTSRRLAELSKQAGHAANNSVGTQALTQEVVGALSGAGGFEKLDNVEPDVIDFFKKNPKLLDNVGDPKVRAAIEKKLGRSPASTAIERRLQSR